jgi:hypothetical protein
VRTLPRAAALLLAVVLAGCPLPQPLPDYPPGTITPPRILMDQITGGDQRVFYVPAECPGAHPTFPLSATLIDVNTIEVVRVRWFVNYDPDLQARSNWLQQSDIEGPGDGATTTARTVPAFVFDAYGAHGTATDPEFGNSRLAGALQIVEMVVSNSFDDSATLLPNRTPTPGFETQAYRWVFVTKAADASLPCPP